MAGPSTVGQASPLLAAGATPLPQGVLWGHRGCQGVARGRDTLRVGPTGIGHS